MSALREALALYGLANARAELIRHNENRTYHVTAPGGEAYLLRVHEPVAGFSLSALAPRRHVEGEIAALQRLAARSNLLLQRPVESLAGRAVESLSSGIPVTVLTWIEGETLENVPLTGEILAALGETVARMHLALAGFRDSRRPAYNAALVSALIDNIDAAMHLGRLSPTQADILTLAARAIARRLPLSPTVLAHADLGKGNLLWNGNRVIPIDFSLSGYAHPAMDLGSLFCWITDEAQRAVVLSSYEKTAGARLASADIDTYFALSVLLFVACQAERSGEWDWFSGAVDRWNLTVFAPLL